MWELAESHVLMQLKISTIRGKYDRDISIGEGGGAENINHLNTP